MKEEKFTIVFADRYGGFDELKIESNDIREAVDKFEQTNIEDDFGVRKLKECCIFQINREV